jgi:hypothetical protein
MGWFSKPKRVRRRLTGVRAILSAAHRDQVTGQVHGHTWEIVAWFLFRGTDQSIHGHTLSEVVKRLDHTCLPDTIAWGEALAEHIWKAVNTEHTWRGDGGSWDCIAVDVNRPSEGIFARFEA